MKIITRNQLIFAGLLTILTIAFRYGLSTLPDKELFVQVWYMAALYGIIICIIGWILGKRDYLSLPLYDVGIRFHATTYIICNIIGELWFVVGFQSTHEHIKIIHLSALIWGLGLLLHFILFLYSRKNAIQGIKKTEIFE